MLSYKKKIYIVIFFIALFLFSCLNSSYMIVSSYKSFFSMTKYTNVNQVVVLPASVTLLDNNLYPIIVSLKNKVLSNFLFFTKLSNGSLIGVRIKVVAGSDNKDIVVKYINKTFDTILNCTDLNFVVYLPSSMGNIYRQLIFYYQNISIIYANYNTTHYMVKLEMTRPYIGDTSIEKYLKYKDFVPPAYINYTFLVSKKDGKAYWISSNKTVYCGYLPLLPPVIINSTRYWLKILNNIDMLINTIKENKELLVQLVQKMENENRTQRFGTISVFTNKISEAIFGIRYRFFSTVITLFFFGNSITVSQEPLVEKGIKELKVKVVTRKWTFPNLNKIGDELRPGVNRFINSGDLELLRKTIIQIVNDLVVTKYKTINITQASGDVEIPLNKRYISTIILPSIPYIREKLRSPYLLISFTGVSGSFRVRYEGFDIEHVKEVIANQYSRIEYLENFLLEKIGNSLMDMVARGEVNESKIINVLEEVRQIIVSYIRNSSSSNNNTVSESLPSNAPLFTPGPGESSTMTKNTARPAGYVLLAIPVIISIIVAVVFLLLRRRRG